MKRKLLAILVVTAMLISMLPLSVIAIEETAETSEAKGSTGVAQIGAETYASFEEAVSASQETDSADPVEITLLADVEIHYPVVINANSVTLNMNGHSIRVADDFLYRDTHYDPMFDVYDQTLTVRGGGTIESCATLDEATNYGGESIFAVGPGTLIIQDDTTIVGHYDYENDLGLWGIMAYENSTVILGNAETGEGPTFDTMGYAVATNGENVSITVYGGTYTVRDTDAYDSAVFGLFHDTDITIYGGTFSGYDIFLACNIYDPETTLELDLTVSGGEFCAARQFIWVCDEIDGYDVMGEVAINAQISGGSFSDETVKQYYTADSQATILPSVAKINGNGYPTLAEALRVANQTKAAVTVELTEDVELTESLFLRGEITLDLQGHTVSQAEDFAYAYTEEDPGVYGAVLFVTGDVTVTGNGVITGMQHPGETDDWACVITVEEGGKLTYLNGALYAYLEDDYYIMPAIYAASNSKLVLGDAETGEGPSIVSYLWNAYCYDGVDITVHGGDYCVYAPTWGGSVNIAVTGYDDTVTPSSITVYGGTFYAESVAEIDSSNIGCYASYADGAQTVTIHGGSFTATCITDIYANDGMHVDASVEIYDGEFIGALYGDYYDGSGTGDIAVTVHGGSFTDKTARDYCTDDAQITVAAATVGETAYESLQEALNAAADGDTVTLLGSAAMSETLYIDSDITLDMNGYDLVWRSDCALDDTHAMIYISGDVVVTGDGFFRGTTTMLEDADIRFFYVAENAALTLLNGTVYGFGEESWGTEGIQVQPGASLILGDAETGEGPCIEVDYTVVYNAGGDVTVYGGSYTARDIDGYWGRVLEGYNGYYSQCEASFTVYGGEFYGSAAVGLLADVYGEVDGGAETKMVLNIYGGTFEGTECAIYFIASSLEDETFQAEVNVYGGSFDAPTAFDFYGYEGPMEVDLNIYGGNFDPLAHLLYAEVYEDSTVQADVDIYDGIFTSRTGALLVMEGEESFDLDMAIHGGTFYDSEFMSYLTEDSTAEIWTAQIGDTFYKLLTDAVAAAKDGDTITLLGHTQLSEPLYIDKNITLDMAYGCISDLENGGTVYDDNLCLLGIRGDVTIINSGEEEYCGIVISNVQGYCAAVKVMEGGKLTMTGGEVWTWDVDIPIYVEEGGTLILGDAETGEGPYVYGDWWNVYSLGDVIIYGGEYEIGLDSDDEDWGTNLALLGGTMTVYDGDFWGRYGNNGNIILYGFWENRNSCVTVYGGTFDSVCNVAAWASEDGSLEGTVSICGGTFTASESFLLTEVDEGSSMDLTVQISGGQFNDPAASEYFTEATQATVQAVTVNGTVYSSLEEALAAAEDGDTVTLYGEHTLSETLIIDKSVTLDMNGSTVRAENGFLYDEELWSVISVQADVVITGNGRIESVSEPTEDDDTNYIISVEPGASLTVLNGEIYGYSTEDAAVVALWAGEDATLILGDKETGEGPTVNSAVAVFQINGGDVTVYGGTYTARGFDGNYGVVIEPYGAGDGSTVTIYGGTFNKGYAVGVYAFEGEESVAAVNIYGGTFAGRSAFYGWAEDGHATATVNVYGGTFDQSGRLVYILTYGDGTVDMDMNIYDGEAETESSMFHWQSYENSTANVDVDISGGTFTTESYLLYGCAHGDSQLNVTVDIADGVFYSESKTVSMKTKDQGTVTAQINIRGGLFSQADAENYFTADSTARIMCAQIGDEIYSSLAEAIAAAVDGDTVTLLGDAVLKNTLYIDKDITLDLNGWELSTAEDFDWYEYYSVLVIEGDVTVTGGGIVGPEEVTEETKWSTLIWVTGDGALTMPDGYLYAYGDGGNTMVDIWMNNDTAVILGNAETGDGPSLSATYNNFCMYSSGTVTIYGGDYLSTGDAEACGANFWVGGYEETVTIYGGHFEAQDGEYGTHRGVLFAVEADAADLTVYGGEFEQSELLWMFTDSDEAAVDLTVYDGCFHGGICQTATARPNVCIHGGSFTDKSLSHDLAEGATATFTGARIGDVIYETLEEAIAAAVDGDTVTLLGRIGLEKTLTVDKDITLDMGGYGIAQIDGFAYDESNSVLHITGNVTVHGGYADGTKNISEADDLMCLFCVSGDGSLTVLDGWVYAYELNRNYMVPFVLRDDAALILGDEETGTGPCVSAAADIVYLEDNTAVTVYGGRYSVNSEVWYGYMFYAYGEHNTVTVYDGVFSHEDGNGTALVEIHGHTKANKTEVNIYGGCVDTSLIIGAYAYDGGHIDVCGNIYGGSFTGDLWWYVAEDSTGNADYTVYGGAFTDRPSIQSYLAEDHHAVFAAVMIGDEVYETIDDGIAAAQDGDTLYLLGSVTPEKALVIDKDITIDGNNYWIDGDDGFEHEDGQSMITVTGNVTIRNARITGQDPTEGDDGSAVISVSGDGCLKLLGQYIDAYKSDDGTSVMDAIHVYDNGHLILGDAETEEYPYVGATYNTVILYDNASVTVYGGELEAWGSDDYCGVNICASGRSNTITVYDGTFTADENGVLFRVFDYYGEPNETEVTVYGGSFATGHIFYLEAWEEGSVSVDADIYGGDFTGGLYMEETVDLELSIHGGTFTDPSLGNYWTEDAEAVCAAATIGDQVYESLEAAVAAAKDGDTITLLGMVGVEKNLVIDKNITIDLNGYEIYATNDFDYSANGAAIGSMLTVTGELTVRGGWIETPKNSSDTKEGMAAILVCGDGYLNMPDGGIYTAVTEEYSIVYAIYACDNATVILGDAETGEGPELYTDYIVVAALDSAEITVYGGTYAVTDETTGAIFAFLNTEESPLDAKLTVYGGSFEDGYATVYVTAFQNDSALDMTVYGGTFTTEVFLWMAGMDGRTADATVNIYGGDFAGQILEKQVWKDGVIYGDLNTDITIYGGTFEDPTAEDYYPENVPTGDGIGLILAVMLLAGLAVLTVQVWKKKLVC